MVQAAAYEPAQWSGYFTMVGGGVAALTGLVFVALSVALSLNIESMTGDATHKYRSINTLAGLTAIFVGCGLALMPRQHHVAVGAELLFTSLAGTGLYLYGFRQAFRHGTPPSKVRLVVGTTLYGCQILGALILLAGPLAGMYILAIAIVGNVAFMISAAWLLVVGVYSARLVSARTS